MKKIIFAIIALLAVTAVSAQTEEGQSWGDLDGMLFPEFKEATVYFKNGRNSKQMMNYDPFDQCMIFIQEGVLMYIHNLEAINYVVIEDRVFVRYDGDIFLTDWRSQYRLLRKLQNDG